MLITLEGLDGSGKTTVWESLRDAIDVPTTFTREPTDSWYGDAVYRSIGDDDADPLAELFLYTADHADHLSRVIRPALEADEVVVSDRYSDSRYAYQGASIEGTVDQPVEYVRDIHRPFTRPPDATLYFDVPPAVGAERAGTTNKFEQAEYLSRVQDNYEQLLASDADRFVRIDATQSVDAVVEAATSEVQRLLEDR